MAPNIPALVRIDAAYTRDKIIRALEKYAEYLDITVVNSEDSDAWEQIKNEPMKLLWMEYEDLPWESLISRNSISLEKTIFNSYCIRKGLIRKAEFAYIVHKYLAKRPSSILHKAIPGTYLLEVDHPDYLDESLMECFEVDEILTKNNEAESRNEMTKLILKPSMANKGDGIMVFTQRTELEDFFGRIYGIDEETSDEDEDDANDDGVSINALRHLRQWIVQRYIDPPLLLPEFENKKFHLRAYCVVVGNMNVYLYDGILALFAFNQYDRDDHLAHLTNTCLQTNLESYDESLSVRAFWDLECESCPRDKLGRLFEQMKLVLADVFDAVCGEVTAFQPVDNAFEIFGIDFLVDSEWNLWFLEANAFPDFKQTGGKLGKLIEELFINVTETAVLPQFGMNVDEKRDTEHQLHSVYSRQKSNIY